MRSCPLCWSKALGDEFHYLLKCEILLKKYMRSVLNFVNLTTENYLNTYLICMSDKNKLAQNTSFHDVCEVYKKFMISSA